MFPSSRSEMFHSAGSQGSAGAWCSSWGARELTRGPSLPWPQTSCLVVRPGGGGGAVQCHPGVDTTSHSCVFALHLLATHPDVQVQATILVQAPCMVVQEEGNVCGQESDVPVFNN